MLAWLEPEQVDDILAEGMARSTVKTIGELTTLHQELHRIRQRGGISFEKEECFAGIACVAAAVRGVDGPVGAISLVSDTKAPLERIAPLVAATARQISLTLSPELANESRPRRRPGALVAPVAPQETWSPETMGRLMAMGQGSWM